MLCSLFLFFFFNDTATTEIYTLSLHDALPISLARPIVVAGSTHPGEDEAVLLALRALRERADVVCIDRKSTRLNSSHVEISYAVFCLKKKKKKNKEIINKKKNKKKTRKMSRNR